MPSQPEQTADKGMPCMDKGMTCGKQESLLTDEQKEAFKTIRLESMKESRPLEDQLRELRTHQQTLMHADKPDLNAINANIDKISDIENQLAKIKAKARVEMMSKLTDEQKNANAAFPRHGWTWYDETGRTGNERPQRTRHERHENVHES